MTNLLKAEINRWFSRRLWWALLLAAVAASLLVLLGAGLAYQPQTPAEIAQAERDYAEAQQQAEQDRKAGIGNPLKILGHRGQGGRGETRHRMVVMAGDAQRETGSAPDAQPLVIGGGDQADGDAIIGTKRRHGGQCPQIGRAHV